MTELGGPHVTSGAAPSPSGSATAAGTSAAAPAPAASRSTPTSGPDPELDNEAGTEAGQDIDTDVGSDSDVDVDVGTEDLSANGSTPGPVGMGRGRRRGRWLRRSSGGRGRPPSLLFDLRTDIPGRYRWGLAALGLVGVFVLWVWAASRPTETVVVPSPSATYDAFLQLIEDGYLWSDLKASGTRILSGYSISIGIGVVLGILMGSLRSAESLFEAPIAFMRYVPAAGLTPLMISWLGIDESPKITLIVLGTVFFNILMVADVARAVPRELIEASYTLGARRWTVLNKVVARHSLPGIIDVARINLAAAWLMLVVSELLAANEGLALRIVKAQRFKGYDTMFAVLFVFGIVGVLSDLLLRRLRDASSPWARP